ncbi:AraC family transcriptional regulator [Leisingera sp.]|uniref:helix-turn-helix transcriptional regulator n=1 Tax=Leisingera sp. TaxID=1879318 RepID=UPI003A928CE5
MPLIRLAPDGAWQTGLSHTRSSHLLIWITRGQGRICVDGSQRGFGPHHAIFIPAGTLWSADFSRRCLGQVLEITGPPSPPFPDHATHKRLANLQEQSRLSALLETINREQAAQETHWQRAVHALSQLAAISLQRQADATPEPARSSAARRLSRAYCRRIAKHPGAQTCMADHAAALSVTPTHLTRVCKAETGRTAAALLTEHQLHAARGLLISTDLPIRDIAGRLGFGSAAYFTRFITHRTGKTPSALRKLAQSSAD